MNYVDVSYLCSEFTPEEINAVGDGNTWKRLISEACIRIDEATFNRIRGVGFDRLTPFQQDCVRKAVCHQAKYISEYGFDESDISSYSVGDISVSVEGGKTAAQKHGLEPLAYSLLKQSGLMSRIC